MDKISIERVLRAGFTILRKDDTPQPRIKHKTGSHDWTTLEKFPTKAARDRRFNELMELSMMLND